MNEKTLSDEFTVELCRPMEINDSIRGQLLDYSFHFIIEESSQTGLMQTVKGRYNIDEQLYTWFRLPTASITVAGTDYSVPLGRIVQGKYNNVVLMYPLASELVSYVAFSLCLNSVIKMADFHPDNISGDESITYADLLSSIFGWTSQVPQRQINVFIRNQTLYCIQRGFEDSVFDISDLPHSEPTINKKINRTLCHNPNNVDNDNDIDDNGKPRRFSGTIFFSTTHYHVSYRYQSGLLVSEDFSSQQLSSSNKLISEQRSNTYYDYQSFTSKGSSSSKVVDQGDGSEVITFSAERDEVYYLTKKTVINVAIEYDDQGNATTTKNEVNTTFHYDNSGGEIWLRLEHEESTETVNGSSDTTVRDTYHVPAGNGWYAQAVYIDGVFQGANLSQGAPGNSVSPYTVDQMQSNLEHTSIIRTTSSAKPSFIEGTTFPVRDSSLQTELNNALRWLHGKITESVSLDLVSKVVDGVPEINHVVDFTERVKFNGHEYFLVSNQISFTPRKFIQKLQLVRWY